VRSPALVLRACEAAATVDDEVRELVPTVNRQENTMRATRMYVHSLIIAGAVLALGAIAVPSVALPDDRVTQVAAAHETMTGFIEYETEGGKVRIPYTIKKKDMAMMKKMEAMKQAFIEYETEGGKVRIPLAMMKASDKMPAGMMAGAIEYEGEGGKMVRMNVAIDKKHMDMLKKMDKMTQAFIEYETEGGKVRIPITRKKT
jgi:cellobiose-specific phosphotransferase system component IIA